MNAGAVEKIAEAVLYEGYLLFPYRRSALKNQQRWTFGGVYPRQYSEAGGGTDPWSMQTECLVLGDERTILHVKVRFLQVVDRTISKTIEGALQPVETLRVGGQVYQPWEEAIERSVSPAGAEETMRLGDLVESGRRSTLEILAGSEEEPLLDGETVVGAITRRWQAMQGMIEVVAQPLDAALDGAGQPLPGYRLTVRITNTTPFITGDRPVSRQRDAALRRTFVATHTILHVEQGSFVSLLEPPASYQPAAERCQNLHTWPVLVGEQGEHDTVLSSPIILYDYPRISPESQGNFFDATEIDELLTLSVLTLTDEEKQEMRESDMRGREILDRTEALTEGQIMKLHGAVRGLRALRKEGA